MFLQNKALKLFLNNNVLDLSAINGPYDSCCLAHWTKHSYKDKHSHKNNYYIDINFEFRNSIAKSLYDELVELDKKIIKLKNDNKQYRVVKSGLIDPRETEQSEGTIYLEPIVS